MMRSSAILFALVLLLTIPLSSQDVQSVAASVDEHYNHLRTLRAEFTEIYRGSGIERTESGTLWLAKSGLKKAGKMRWEYRSPSEKLLVSDGKDAWFYVPGDRQVRKMAMGNLEDVRSPLAFLLGKSKLRKELQGLSIAPDVTAWQAGDIILRGVPLAMADRISQILLEIDPGHQIVRIVMESADGSTTEYRFTGQVEDVDIPGSKFDFRPPAGTEIVEDEAAGG